MKNNKIFKNKTLVTTASIFVILLFIGTAVTPVIGTRYVPLDPKLTETGSLNTEGDSKIDQANRYDTKASTADMAPVAGIDLKAKINFIIGKIQRALNSLDSKYSEYGIKLSVEKPDQIAASVADKIKVSSATADKMRVPRSISIDEVYINLLYRDTPYEILSYVVEVMRDNGLDGDSLFMLLEYLSNNVKKPENLFSKTDSELTSSEKETMLLNLIEIYDSFNSIFRGLSENQMNSLLEIIGDEGTIMREMLDKNIPKDAVGEGDEEKYMQLLNEFNTVKDQSFQLETYTNPAIELDMMRATGMSMVAVTGSLGLCGGGNGSGNESMKFFERFATSWYDTLAGNEYLEQAWDEFLVDKDFGKFVDKLKSTDAGQAFWDNWKKYGNDGDPGMKNFFEGFQEGWSSVNNPDGNEYPTWYETPERFPYADPDDDGKPNWNDSDWDGDGIPNDEDHFNGSSFIRNLGSGIKGGLQACPIAAAVAVATAVNTAVMTSAQSSQVASAELAVASISESTEVSESNKIYKETQTNSGLLPLRPIR